MDGGGRSLRLLILGGSGFLSGTLAREAVARGHRVWTVTRGRRPAPAGAAALVADRHDDVAMAEAIAGAGTDWDLVVDCIGFEPGDAEQDRRLFRGRAPQLVFISSDFVFDPAHRRFPQTEEADQWATEGYGGNKRRCEQLLLDADAGGLAVTVLRPCHIYGPGSRLGCLPKHGRDPELLDRLRAGKPLELVGGGHFLQQPILARDLAAMVLSVAGCRAAEHQAFCAAGPDIAESRHYYRIIADLLGVECHIGEVPVAAWLGEEPGSAPFLCHRFYDLSKARQAGLEVPATSLRDGLQEHVASLA